MNVGLLAISKAASLFLNTLTNLPISDFSFAADVVIGDGDDVLVEVSGQVADVLPHTTLR